MYVFSSCGGSLLNGNSEAILGEIPSTHSYVAYTLIPLFMLIVFGGLIYKRQELNREFRSIGSLQVRKYSLLFLTTACLACTLASFSTPYWSHLEGLGNMGVLTLCLEDGSECIKLLQLNLSQAAKDKIYSIQVMMVLGVITGLYGVIVAVCKIAHPKLFKCYLGLDRGSDEVFKLSTPQAKTWYYLAFWVHLTQCLSAVASMSFWSAVMFDHLQHEFGSGSNVTMDYSLFLNLPVVFLSLICAGINLTFSRVNGGGSNSVNKGAVRI